MKTNQMKCLDKSCGATFDNAPKTPISCPKCKCQYAIKIGEKEN